MKNKLLHIIGYFVPFILFNIIFFVASGFSNPLSVWISYGLIVFSYFMMVLSSYFNNDVSLNGFIKFSNKLISLLYFIIEFIVGLVFIIIRLDTCNICLYVQLPILCVYIVLLVFNVLYNDKSKKDIINRQQDINFINQCELSINLIMQQITDDKINNQLSKLKEDVLISPVKSCDEAKALEVKIIELLNKISNSCEINDDEIEQNVNRVSHMLFERNAVIKVHQ